MASITFTGPSPTGTGTDTVTVEVDDSALLAVIQGVCGLEGYTGSSPGLFTIRKTIEIWRHQAGEWARQQATITMNQTLDQQLAVLNQVTVTSNGQPVDLSSLTNQPSS